MNEALNDPTFPWLSVIGAVPLAGAVAVAAVPRGRELLAKQLAVAVSLVVLALVVALGSPDAAGEPPDGP